MKLKFSPPAYKALSSVSSNFSAVFLATFIVPVFSGKFDISNLSVILFSLFGLASFTFLSATFAEKGEL